MKVAIDVSQIVYGTGVATYTRNLVENLVKARGVEFTVFGGSLRERPKITEWMNSLPENVNKKLLYLSPSISDFLWNKVHYFSIDPLIGKQDILHSSDWTQPVTSAIKVTTIHDLAPIKLPEYTHPKIVSVHTRRLKWVKKEANAVIVPSQSTKADLVDLGFKEEIVHVIPEASEKIFKKANKDEIRAVLEKYKIEKPYLLTVGTGPRKNTARLIKAFSQFNDNLELIITGRPMVGYKITHGVKFVGFIPTEDLVALYSEARALIYPSLYEGFGLPVLDAFSVGCPVVTSNTSSMLEVAGGAAVLVDPESTKDLARGIEECLHSRDSHIKKGYIQSEKFSWERTSKMTLDLYKKLFDNNI
jgi:glycosyltransferase involved in cell wall biosynthesis